MNKRQKIAVLLESRRTVTNLIIDMDSLHYACKKKNLKMIDHALTNAEGTVNDIKDQLQNIILKTKKTGETNE